MNRKLTIEEVQAIRRLAKHTEMSYRELGQTYGVTKSAVAHILAERNWPTDRQVTEGS